MKNNGSLLGTCILSAGIGVFILLLFPKYYLFSILLIGIGIAVFIYDRLTKDKFELLWKNLGLCKGGLYPKLIRNYEENKKNIYHFWVPVGLGKDDFEHNKSAIVQFFGYDVTVERDGRQICISKITKE